MSISEKLTAIAQNTPRVYEAGKKVSYEDGFGAGYTQGKSHGYTKGEAAGKQAEYDRFWDSFQENGTRKSYHCAFAGSCWTPQTFKPKYPIKPVDTSSTTRYGAFMFYYFGRGQKGTKGFTPCSITPDIVDFSECINVRFAFNNAWFDEVTADFGNATSLEHTFALGDGGGGIRKLNLRVTEKITAFTNTFGYASPLVELTFTDDSVIAGSIDLKWSTNLSLDSGKSILKTIKDYSGTANEDKYTVSLPGELWEKLDADGETSPTGGTWKQFIEQKGWTY